jgi:glycolate oxidase iron-sulfur subunit
VKHAIPVEDLGPLATEMADAVTKCVHCGFCLPTCPTYNVLHEEMDSPRGRIVLMKSVLEGQIELEEAIEYIDNCLGCLGCVSVCPSGVPYGELLTPFRFYAEGIRQRPFGSRMKRWITKETLPYPDRFRLATKAGNLAKPLSKLAPTGIQSMLDMIPSDISTSKPLPSVIPAQGEPRARVALLTSCVQQVLAQEINWATLRVLAKNRVEVIIPQNQGCCGALALHTGDYREAKAFAENNIKTFPSDVDAILTNTAGCGSCMHEYRHLFKGSEYENQAVEFSDRVLDVSVFLSNLGITPPPDSNGSIKVAYHDACHLSHAQGITKEPRDLLQSIPNVTLMPIPEGDLCCGSAGSYNLEHPKIAKKLGNQKVENILSIRPDMVVAGNIGCLVQLRMHLNQLNQLNNTAGGVVDIPNVMHTIELLDYAYRQVL